MVIITSNSNVGEWYSLADISALRRRLTEVIDCNEPLYDDIVMPPDDEPVKLGRMRVETFQAKQREERGVFAEHRREPRWIPSFAHDGAALATTATTTTTDELCAIVDGIL